MSNTSGETPLDIARRLQQTQCIELIHVEFLWESHSSQELYDSEDDLDEKASPRLSRNHRSSAPTSGASSSSSSSSPRVNGANGGSRPCQTYENLDFLYNSATYDGSGAPPLPAKSIQSNNTGPSPPFAPAGRSDPQISFIPQDVSPGLSPRHSSYHASHPSNLQARASPSPPLPGHDGQGSRPPRSPQVPGVTLRGHRQTMSWEGQAVSQNRIGPVSDLGSKVTDG
ncbi:hypothetical protein CRUP_030909 [Coryphaenoides rupestris]|nr:hypothetical protein CRUP_030909 [Coryphaenoides rupestris]